jgi:hypothetical protein
MKKVLFFAVALCLLASSAAMGADMTKRIGLGFVDSDAPIGGRYWFSEKVGLDLGFGLNKDEEFNSGTGEKESLTHWRVLGALPIKIHSVGDNRVNFNFLPAVMYNSIDNGSGMSSDNVIDLFFGLEFEAFVTEAFSVGASHGVVIVLDSPGDSTIESTTDIHLTGGNLTNFGFHYYLPGGE